MTKQGQLKGMPAKTQAEKDGDALIDKWENLQNRKAEFTAAKKTLIASLKKANRSKLSIVDSDGIKREIEYKESEGLTVRKAGPEKEEE